MKKRLGLALILVTLCHQAQSSDQITIFGIQDCGRWVTVPNKGWLIGFLSGMNNALAKPGNDPLEQLGSADQAFLWVDNYCKANPLSNSASAAAQLYLELQARSTKKK